MIVDEYCVVHRIAAKTKIDAVADTERGGAFSAFGYFAGIASQCAYYSVISCFQETVEQEA